MFAAIKAFPGQSEAMMAHLAEELANQSGHAAVVVKADDAKLMKLSTFLKRKRKEEGERKPSGVRFQRCRVLARIDR